MLEILVHIDDAEAMVAKEHVCQRVSFDDAEVVILRAESLPPTWDARPETPASQGIGDEWSARAETVVLAVPSVVVPAAVRYELLYMTYLLAAEHPRFHEAVEVAEPDDLDWDPRLRRRGGP